MRVTLRTYASRTMSRSPPLSKMSPANLKVSAKALWMEVSAR